MYLQLVILTALLQLLNVIGSVLICPFSIRAWMIREKEFNCNKGHGFKYHCLLDIHDRPVEVCMKRRWYRRDGCPWVLQTDEGDFLGEPLTPCQNILYCPSNYRRFYSNELYLHPACLVKKEERLKFMLPDIFYDQSSSNSNDIPHQICRREEFGYKALFFVLLGTNCLIIAIKVTFCIAKKYKRRQGTSGTRTENRNYGNCRYLRNLKKTIDNGDNPEKVHASYKMITDLGEHEYMNCLPKLGNKRVSFLIYAAKKNRKKTVLYFLQRYLDGYDVFKEDIYSVDSNNENIMRLAIIRGWTDVVNKLQEVDDSYFNDELAVKLTKSLYKADIAHIY